MLGCRTTVGHRPGGMREGPGAVQHDGYTPQAGADGGGVIQVEDTLLQSQFPGQQRQRISVPPRHDGPIASAARLVGDERAGITGGAVDQEVGHVSSRINDNFRCRDKALIAASRLKARLRLAWAS